MMRLRRIISQRNIKKAGRPGGDHAIRWLGVYLKIAKQFSNKLPPNIKKGDGSINVIKPEY
jgi:hypothetical protein